MRTDHLIRGIVLGLAVLGLAGCTHSVQPAQAFPPTPTAETVPALPAETPQPAAPVSVTAYLKPEPSPTSSPNEPPICPEDHGRIERAQLEFAGLDAPLQFRVYLPPCYRQDVDTRYPALYLIHGQGFKDDQWERMGAGETADRLIHTGEGPPFLIVMPYDPDYRQPDEYPYADAIATGLVPWVDAHYRTRPERAFRAIGGLSRGAAWALHLGLNHWDLFGAVGGHSLPVFWTDGPRLNGWLDAIPPEAMPRFYLDIGSSDGLLRWAAGFENLLNRRGIPHEWHLFTGPHNETYWTAHLEQYLRWYVEGWGEG